LLSARLNEDDGCQFAEEAVTGRVLSTRSYADLNLRRRSFMRNPVSNTAKFRAENNFRANFAAINAVKIYDMEYEYDDAPENHFSIKNLYGEFDTQEQLDAEYNVETAVANFSTYIKGYVSGSEKARKRLTDRVVVSYGHTNMEKLTVYPGKEADSPVLLFIHGGYWRMGIGDDFDFTAIGPYDAGFTVVIVTYGLAPKVNIPEMVRQVKSAIAWTAKNISHYNGDPERIFVSGHSAGAHLAAMTINTNWDDYSLPRNTVKGILAISGLYDLEPVSQTFIQPAVRITAEQILTASPLRLMHKNDLPLIVAWGDSETNAFKKQSSSYLHSWKHTGNTGHALIVPRADHFSILQEFETPNGLLTKAVQLLLKNTL